MQTCLKLEDVEGLEECLPDDYDVLKQLLNAIIKDEKTDIENAELYNNSYAKYIGESHKSGELISRAIDVLNTLVSEGEWLSKKDKKAIKQYIKYLNTEKSFLKRYTEDYAVSIMDNAKQAKKAKRNLKSVKKIKKKLKKAGWVEIDG